jgi:hypothetical protein
MNIQIYNKSWLVLANFIQFYMYTNPCISSFFLPSTFLIVRYIHKENYFGYIYGNLLHGSMTFIIALNFLFELQET